MYYKQKKSVFSAKQPKIYIGIMSYMAVVIENNQKSTVLQFICV
nr:MAG TPA: hypothetical protein [Caudoviricetes sp.]